jgi:hypothetical protein
MVNKRIGLTQTSWVLSKRDKGSLDGGSQRFQYCKDECVGQHKRDQHVHHHMYVQDVLVELALMQQEVGGDEDNNTRNRSTNTCTHMRRDVLM